MWKQYLAQEYINVTPKKTQLYLDWDIVESEVYYDFCPHIFYKNGKMIWCGHVLVRYSANRIVNVLKWGGIGYWRQINFSAWRFKKDLFVNFTKSIKESNSENILWK